LANETVGIDLKRVRLVSIGLSLLLTGSYWGGVLRIAPVRSQAIPSAQGVWRQVYEKIADFPKENQYISLTTGKVAADNTLAARLIRYHVFLKGRSPLYRLDWKLTLADYLTVNEVMTEVSYPGRDALKTSPLQGDQAAIRRLTRQQRDTLVQVLVSSFNPQAAPAASTPSKTAAPTPTSKPEQRSLPTTPKPGDAQLLKP
jgi:hypothetical protein